LTHNLLIEDGQQKRDLVGHFVGGAGVGTPLH